ncbi:hypothetical protein ACFLTL_02590 [Chloroflexota bacterium]
MKDMQSVDLLTMKAQKALGEARDEIRALEAWRGNIKEYYYLVEPLAELVYSTNVSGSLHPSTMERFVERILVEAPVIYRPETTPIGTPTVSLTAQFLADQIKPWVEEIRQTLFHSKSPPFKSVKDAVSWQVNGENVIESWLKSTRDYINKVDEFRRNSKEQKRRIEKYIAFTQPLLDKYPPLTKLNNDKQLASLKEGVDYPSKEEWRQANELLHHADSIVLGEYPEQPEKEEHGKTLGALLDSVIKISKVTGFTNMSIMKHILVGEPLILPPLTLDIVREPYEVPWGNTIVNSYAKLIIRSDLTFKEMRSAYQKVRKELGLQRLKQYEDRHLYLYQLVHERGGPPIKKGTVAFWESIRKEWNKRYPKLHHPGWQYTTWKGVKYAYDRLIRKVKKQIMLEQQVKEIKEVGNSQEVT